MMLHYISDLLLSRLNLDGWCSLTGWRQYTEGWTGVFKDETNGQEYVLTARPIKSSAKIPENSDDCMLCQEDCNCEHICSKHLLPFDEKGY